MIFVIVFLTALINLAAGFFIAVYLGYGPRWLHIFRMSPVANDPPTAPASPASAPTPRGGDSSAPARNENWDGDAATLRPVASGLE